MPVLDAEFAVVGLGAMGSHALWRLASRGKEVLGFEQFQPGHPFGSTHGKTRLFRTLCLEHPGLVPMARRSIDLWRELEAETDTSIVSLCGLLNMGATESGVIRGVQAAAAAHGQAVRRLTAAEIRKEFPQHGRVGDTDVAILDPIAGVARPEAAVLAATSAAAAAGARLFTQTGVIDVTVVDQGVRIRTAARDFLVAQAIVTPGPWLSHLMPGLPMLPTRTPLTWFTPSHDPGTFSVDRFPAFIRDLGEGNRIWGHGSDTDHDVKVGPEDDPHYSLVNPDLVDRSISTDDYALVSRLVSEFLPDLDPQPSGVAACMITRTPDHQFLLGRPYGDPRLLLGGGDSGHAFKHAPGLGEVLAQLACGEEPFTDIDFMDPNRFR
ncbi:sarcosine oxidase [Nakamurella panacisegetis]|uniref:Sarcosine oxidase n=1 Tax=Nakamurella panacisegetis TaxID=1090615 RepID=A0A1H0HDT8_9ACTN|nr:N-methyl-L-tryptophan oxidase [Nakamurella panacisegetis]SDO17335.1 sarcosine oxidase [Nakamurella panacisegetis]